MGCDDADIEVGMTKQDVRISYGILRDHIPEKAKQPIINPLEEVGHGDDGWSLVDRALD